MSTKTKATNEQRRAEAVEPWVQIPEEIIAAAHKVSNWAKKQGWKDWIIGPVADRELAERASLPKAPAAIWDSRNSDETASAGNIGERCAERISEESDDIDFNKVVAIINQQVGALQADTERLEKAIDEARRIWAGSDNDDYVLISRILQPFEKIMEAIDAARQKDNS